MRRLLLLTVLGAVLALSATGTSAEDKDKDKKPKDAGFVAIFDGKTLKGWHVSAESGHSNKSKHKSGGQWEVIDDYISGKQDMPGNGGILITDKQDYRNFEVALEMKNDFGPDSGLFLRSNNKGQAHQALIDYYEGGSLMGVYGEGLNPGYHARNFTFLDSPEKIKENTAPFKLPVTPEKWPEFWKHGTWNALRARIEGNPAKITTWIKDLKFFEFQDTVKRQETGGIALQVHGGREQTFKQSVRYRNIRVKVLD
jgi:hypothetical protein